VETALYSVDDIYNVSKDKAEKMRFEAIKHSFTHHYTESPFYGDYCRDNNVSPEDIKTTEDFKKIPLITDRFFKDYPEPNENPKRFLRWLKAITPLVPNVGHIPANIDDIVSTLHKKGFSPLFSSGSTGTMSFVPYDETTLDRKKYQLIKALYSSGMIGGEGGHNPHSLVIPTFVPNPYKSCMGGIKMLESLEDISDEVWWASDRVITPSFLKEIVGTGESKYSISRNAGKSENENEKNQQAEYMGRIINRLVDIDRTKEKDVIIGSTPGPIYGMLRAMEKEGISVDLHDIGWVIFSGGWENISQIEPKKKVKKVLNIPPARCIGIYAMTEISSVMPSCTDEDSFYYHVPYFTQAFVRSDDGDLSEYGRGRLTFLDPMPTSYPAFLAIGDEGEILPKCPLCKREGQVITKVRRKEGEDAKGCRVALDRIADF